MESGLEQAESEKSSQKHVVTIAPEAPEKESPQPLDEENELTQAREQRRSTREVHAELAVMLSTIEGYFIKEPDSLDLEALNFCLRHLFSHIDSLYRGTLPELNKWNTQSPKSLQSQSEPITEQFQHQKI